MMTTTTLLLLTLETNPDIHTQDNNAAKAKIPGFAKFIPKWIISATKSH